MKKQNPSYSLLFAITLGINAVIGAGVFTMPIVLFKTAGPASILSIILASICVLFIGLGLARVSFLVPEEGGFYTYVSSWAGKFFGGLISATYLIGLTMCLGILTKYVSSVIALYFTGIEIQYINYTVIFGTFIAALFASSVAQIGQLILFVLTLLPLFVIGILCLKNFSINNFYPYFTNGTVGVIKGVPGVLFSFFGFESISAMTRVVKNPKINIPIATLSTILISALCYIFFVGSVIGSIPKNLLVEKTNLSEVLLYAFPNVNWIINFINISIVLTIIGTIYAVTLALSELLIGTVSKITNKKFQISETLSAFFVCLMAIFFSYYIKNIGVAFSVVSIFIVSVYTTTTFYLLVKGKSWIDYLIGIIATISNFILISAAVLQLI